MRRASAQRDEAAEDERNHPLELENRTTSSSM
jgi:hypothetical protein